MLSHRALFSIALLLVAHTFALVINPDGLLGARAFLLRAVVFGCVATTLLASSSAIRVAYFAVISTVLKTAPGRISEALAGVLPPASIFVRSAGCLGTIGLLPFTLHAEVGPFFSGWASRHGTDVFNAVTNFICPFVSLRTAYIVRIVDVG